MYPSLRPLLPFSLLVVPFPLSYAAEAAEAEALGQLLEGLSSEQPYLRHQCFSQLQQIARGLGPERTRGEFLPYLKEFADSEEDETLLILAEQLGSFAPVS